MRRSLQAAARLQYFYHFFTRYELFLKWLMLLRDGKFCAAIFWPKDLLKAESLVFFSIIFVNSRPIKNYYFIEFSLLVQKQC